MNTNLIFNVEYIGTCEVFVPHELSYLIIPTKINDEKNYSTSRKMVVKEPQVHQGMASYSQTWYNKSFWLLYYNHLSTSVEIVDC